MKQKSSQFDIDCLRLIAADPEARQASLSAAMIKLHALTIARADPSLRGEALEIVHHLEALYPRLPTRISLDGIVRDRCASALSETALSGLVSAIWDHFRLGRA